MNKSTFDKIKKLRALTGTGVLECKNALFESDYDLDRAIINLKKKGFSVAEKKILRETPAGLVSILIDNNKKNAVIVEIACETDFVSKLDEFKSYVKGVLDHYLNKVKNNSNFFLSGSDILLDNSMVSDLNNLISKVGENIVIKRIKRVYTENGYIISYLHGGIDFGQIGVLLIIDNFFGNFDSAYDVAMQIAAMNPEFISKNDVPEKSILQEKGFYFESFKKLYFDKSDSIINKMVEGKINKFYKEKVLLEQSFIKDSTVSVKNFVNNNFNILDFVRFSIKF